MSATKTLMSLDPTKSIVSINSRLADGKKEGEHQFSHKDLLHIGDPTGISTEEGEFLYGLIKLIQPENCLETGTNVGVSASYICLALKENNKGHLTTIEHSEYVADIAKNKLSNMGFDNFTVFRGIVDNYSVNETNLDFLWLDTELKTRYAELVRFFPYMRPGAIACIHDLWHLDFNEFGGVPDALRQLIQSGDLRALTFQTTHGLTVFQKRRTEDYLAEI